MDITLFSNEADYKTGFADLTPDLWSRECPALGTTILTSLEIRSDFPIKRCLPSWNLLGGHNGRTEVFVRGRREGKADWSVWYPMGVWSQNGAYGGRHSVDGQEDKDGRVSTDTLIFKEPVSFLQMRLRLGESRKGGTPELTGAGLAWSNGPMTRPVELTAEDLPAVDIEGLPAHSQMVYADGGDSWCSPTSVSMIVSYWRGGKMDPRACVREAVTGVYDPVYNGHGNWSFNAAWAGSLGYRAVVRQFTRLSQLVPFLRKGIPLVMSVSFDKDRPLDGAPLEKSAGHLTVIKGFDGKGQALMHEPASPSDKEVPRSYDCAQLEARWLEASGGVCYIISPRTL